MNNINFLSQLKVFFVLLACPPALAAHFNCESTTRENDTVKLSYSESTSTISVNIENSHSIGPHRRLPPAKTLDIKFTEQLGSNTVIFASRDNSGRSDDDMVFLNIKYNRETKTPYHISASLVLAVNRYQEFRQSLTFSNCVSDFP